MKKILKGIGSAALILALGCGMTGCKKDAKKAGGRPAGMIPKAMVGVEKVAVVQDRTL